MTIQKIRSQIEAGIWQGIAKSRVDLTGIPQGQVEVLVSSITDRMMATVNSIFEENILQEAQRASGGEADLEQHAVEKPEDDNEEKILWQGRPFLALNESYILTNERLKIIRGLLSRNIENYELVRIQDIDFKQNLGERMVGI